eukprot:scaffold2852_cov54-Cyclotella_meneghiniana.AAC.3
MCQVDVVPAQLKQPPYWYTKVNENHAAAPQQQLHQLQSKSQPAAGCRGQLCHGTPSSSRLTPLLSHVCPCPPPTHTLSPCKMEIEFYHILSMKAFLSFHHHQTLSPPSAHSPPHLPSFAWSNLQFVIHPSVEAKSVDN